MSVSDESQFLCAVVSRSGQPYPDDIPQALREHIARWGEAEVPGLLIRHRGCGDGIEVLVSPAASAAERCFIEDVMWGFSFGFCAGLYHGRRDA